MNNEDEINISLDSSTITIDLNDTYGATTSYLTDDMSYTITGNHDTIVISDGINSSHTLVSDWTSTNVDIESLFGTTYNEKEIERMCKEYPGLEKVWNNFKSVYDMCKQDYEGKKRAGELDE